MSPSSRVRAAVAAALVLAVLATAAIVVGRLNAGGGRSPAAGGPGAATVVRVVDGDTLVVALERGGEENVRLIGIDTPESVARDRPVECWGAEASDQLAALVPPGTAVRLERDLEARDRYDRLLAYVVRAADDVLVNRVLVEGGAAVAYEFPPNTAWSDELAAAERGARAGGAGLWGACGGPDVTVGPPPG